ncbi:MAG: DUF2752 domain-containing protein [Acidimicrobiales bacterium]
MASTITTRAPAVRFGSWPHRLWGIGAAAAGVAACAYVYAVDPNESGGYPVCPSKALFGVDCPGCGGLRLVHALLHGDIGRAFDHNVFLMVSLPFVLAFTAYWAFGAFVRPVAPIRLTRRAAWVILGVALAFSVVRNLPWEPLTYLASAAS